MNNARDVIGECIRRRIRLRVVGDEVRAFPRTLLTGDMREAIAKHTAELVALVKLERCHAVLGRIEAMVWAAEQDGNEILPVQSVKAVLKEMNE